MKTLIIILLIIFAISIGAIAACHQVTHSHNLFKFIVDFKYWTFAILNYQYIKAKTEKMPIEQFMLQFTREHLSRKGFKRIFPLPEKIRVQMIIIMSNPQFIENNLGVKYYSYKYHTSVLATWEKLKNSNKEVR